MEEMLEDTFESMEDGEDMEEEAEEEVDKILFEITAGEQMCSALNSALDLCHKQKPLTVRVCLFL